jgi:hypothetical protein
VVCFVQLHIYMYPYPLPLQMCEHWQPADTCRWLRLPVCKTHLQVCVFATQCCASHSSIGVFSGVVWPAVHGLCIP